MNFEENKALARRAIDEVWSKGNLAVATEVYGPNFVSHQHSHPHVRDVRGLPALIEFVREFREAFPDFQDTIDDQVADGGKVVTRFTSTGTHRAALMGLQPSNKRASWMGHRHRSRRGRQNRRGVAQMGSVRDDATAGRRRVENGSSFQVYQLHEIPP
jgi:predicted ester cyclase